MKKLTTEEFIEKAKKIHGEKYDYSKTIYEKCNIKICIICPEHGEFWQTPSEHLSGYGCKYCGGTNKLTTEEFIEKAKKIHGDKYDYSKAEYINSKTKICIICPKHGEFWIRPNDHLNGQGCRKCSDELNGLKKRKTKEQFIEEARKIHGNKYDYSKVEYLGLNKKVCIICPEHGEFWQSPYGHLRGDGCSKCSVSLLENELIEFLNKKNISYTFRNRSLPWLNGLELDFYLPEYNAAIECQGIQHFVEKHFFEPLEKIQERDSRKLKLCKENGIKLLYYSNLGISYPYFVYENKESLLNDIIYD